MAKTRLLSLDVFRGATVAGMLLVNNPGNWGAMYPPLAHAAWHGWTPTDLIFPFFLFIVGVTTHLSLGTRAERGEALGPLRRQIVRRGLLIFAIGLALNAFPFFWWGAIDGVPAPTFWDRVVYRVEHLRVLGVLQRIGLAYLLGAMLAVGASLRQLVTALVVLLFGYWWAMTLLPVPGLATIGATVLDTPASTLAAWVDRLVLGDAHIYAGTKTYDPEGILATIPAAGTVLTGVLCGRWLASSRPLTERLLGMFVVGALAAALGSMWGWSFPVNKQLWTSSYVLLTAGLAALTLATTAYVTDVLGSTGWTRAFVIFGTNPIVAFVGSGVMTRLIVSILKLPTPLGPVSV
ncbi:MAG: heparan-alpha-glucosaminide N-acetyltransferase domain-containing protein, partial [Gemmatimonadaceae bacterium]|nr:heparan-alpha-glucosaminide N-acetyltransferase domain-containing protein [Gemmatimonadaceae bacterium]